MSATATLSDLHVVLIDTRPDDGFAPSVTLSGSDILASIASNGWRVEKEGTDPFSSLSYANGESIYNGMARISSDPSNGSHTLTASSFAKDYSDRYVYNDIDIGGELF